MSDFKWDDYKTADSLDSFNWDEYSPVETEMLDLKAIEQNPVIEGATTAAVLEGGRRLAEGASQTAENLAFRALGGSTTPTGRNLTIDQAKGMSKISTQEIGREALDKKLLGSLGLGSDLKNLSKAQQNLIEVSKPKTELLQSIDQPISRKDILDKTKQYIDVDNLDPSIPTEKQISKNIEKRTEDFSGEMTPLEAEQKKIKLQEESKYRSTAKESAKSQISKAQAKATKEAVEEAVLKSGGEDLLEEFRNIKKQTAKAGIAKDIIEESIGGADTVRFGTFGRTINNLADLAGKKIPGAAAAFLDTMSQFAKTKTAKAIPKVGGVLSAVTGGAEAAEAGFGPGSIAGIAAAEAVNPIPLTDVTQGAIRARKALDAGKSVPEAMKEAAKGFVSPAAETLETTGEKLSTEAREGKAKSFDAADRLVQQSKVLNKFKQTKNNTSKVSSEIDTDSLQSLAASARMVGSKFADQLDEIASKEGRAKEAAIFSLNQNPGFRQFLRKVEENED